MSKVRALADTDFCMGSLLSGFTLRSAFSLLASLLSSTGDSSVEEDNDRNKVNSFNFEGYAFYNICKMQMAKPTEVYTMW